MDDQADFVLWGSSGHALVLSDTIALRGGRVIQLIDNDPAARSVLEDVPISFGENGLETWVIERDIASRPCYGATAIGGARGEDRLAILEFFKQLSIPTPPIIHPAASVSRSATIGEGVQILSRAIVAACATIGAGCILNHGSQVDHESQLGPGVHLAPGAVLCGCVSLGRAVMIGANATVLPRVSVGDNTIVGAGSVVTHELPKNVVACGVPAKVIRCR